MIVLFLANAWGFCVANWKLLLLILAGVIVFFWLVSFSFCGSPNDKKADAIKEEILTDKILSNVANAEVTNRAEVANQSLENVNSAKNKDSSTFSNNYDEAIKRFCADFCKDDLCREFRAKGLCK